MGLEVTRILARAKGSFQSRKMKKSTLGMSSNRSQYRTLWVQKLAHWGGRDTVLQPITPRELTHSPPSVGPGNLPGGADILIQQQQALVGLTDIGCWGRWPRCASIGLLQAGHSTGSGPEDKPTWLGHRALALLPQSKATREKQNGGAECRPH